MSTPPAAQTMRPRPRGFTLIELSLATAIGALLLSALVHVARLATESRSELSGATEQRIEAAFVMERLRTAAREAVVSGALAPGLGDTGRWLAPKRFCINDSKALVETTVEDADCRSGEVIADRVEDLRVSASADQSALDAPVVVVSVTLPSVHQAQSLVLSQSIRVKGLLE